MTCALRDPTFARMSTALATIVQEISFGAAHVFELIRGFFRDLRQPPEIKKLRAALTKWLGHEYDGLLAVADQGEEAVREFVLLKVLEQKTWTTMFRALNGLSAPMVDDVALAHAADQAVDSELALILRRTRVLQANLLLTMGHLDLRMGALDRIVEDRLFSFSTPIIERDALTGLGQVLVAQALLVEQDRRKRDGSTWLRRSLYRIWAEGLAGILALVDALGGDVPADALPLASRRSLAKDQQQALAVQIRLLDSYWELKRSGAPFVSVFGRPHDQVD